MHTLILCSRALAEKFPGGQRKKQDRKIAPLSLLLLYQISMSVGSGGEGPEVAVPLWIFLHGTDIVDRDLIVLFFRSFCYASVFFPLPSSPEEA